MIVSQALSTRPIPSQHEIAAAVVLLRSFAPATLASAIRNGFDVETFTLAGSRERGAGLAPWQLKRAKALIENHLVSGIRVEQVATVCGLSRSQFARAFRASTGFSPHSWLIRRRVEKARELLSVRTTPLVEVAFACGFSDQSHFTRLFRRATGVTPRAWRGLYLAKV
jgi:AraC-like DNA-binding protein